MTYVDGQDIDTSYTEREVWALVHTAYVPDGCGRMNSTSLWSRAVAHSQHAIVLARLVGGRCLGGCAAQARLRARLKRARRAAPSGASAPASAGVRRAAA